MAVGNSGRIVIEIEPELKQHLHRALQQQGLTLKDWFVENARHFLRDGRQLALDFSAPPEPADEAKP